MNSPNILLQSKRKTSLSFLSISLFLGLALYIFSGELFANNNQRWDPAAIELELSPGQSEVITVTHKLRGNRELRYVASKKIRPYISLESKLVEQQRGWNTVQLSVSISIPQDAELGAIKGNIRSQWKFGKRYWWNRGVKLPVELNIAEGAPVDTTPPVITLFGDNPLELDQGEEFIDPGATALDDVDGDLTASIVVLGDVVDTNTIGEYAIIYSISDKAGNAAEQLTREVNVIGGSGLPPDPGEAGKVTLEGIDSDEDGLRDDVQIAISYLDFESEQEVNSAKQFAISIQEALLSGSDVLSNNERNENMFAASDCLESIFGFDEARVISDYLVVLVVNTDDRIQNYGAFNSLPMSLEIDPDADLGAKCD